MTDLVARVKRQLARQGDLWGFEDLIQAIKDGEMQSFSDDDGNWVVTRICVFPKRRALEISFMVGEYGAIRRIETEQVIPFARAQGIDLLMASGRVGFINRKPKDWKLVSATYLRDI